MEGVCGQSQQCLLRHAAASEVLILLWLSSKNHQIHPNFIEVKLIYDLKITNDLFTLVLLCVFKLIDEYHVLYYDVRKLVIYLHSWAPISLLREYVIIIRYS